MVEFDAKDVPYPVLSSVSEKAFPSTNLLMVFVMAPWQLLWAMMMRQERWLPELRMMGDGLVPDSLILLVASSVNLVLGCGQVEIY